MALGVNFILPIKYPAPQLVARTFQLALQGADVIKVEPLAGDDMRASAVARSSWRMSGKASSPPCWRDGGIITKPGSSGK